jgi:hypothetical protein
MGTALTVLYGWETWSPTLREEHRLRVLRRIFGQEAGENCKMRSFITCTLLQV